jgi:hypothetical protein
MMVLYDPEAEKSLAIAFFERGRLPARRPGAERCRLARRRARVWRGKYDVAIRMIAAARA